MTSNTTYDLYGVYGFSPTSVLAVGDKGTPASCNGAAWAAANPEGVKDEWLSVWGSSATDIFAAAGDETFGGSAGVLHFDGATWTAMDIDPTNALWAVWGSSASKNKMRRLSFRKRKTREVDSWRPAGAKALKNEPPGRKTLGIQALRERGRRGLNP
jgi:hypothetical protein